MGVLRFGRTVRFVPIGMKEPVFRRKRRRRCFTAISLHWLNKSPGSGTNGTTYTSVFWGARWDKALFFGKIVSFTLTKPINGSQFYQNYLSVTQSYLCD